MNIERYTHASQELISRAAQVANEHHNPTLEPIHFLYASLENEFCRSFFSMFMIPIEDLRTIAEHSINSLPSSLSSRLAIGQAAEHFLYICNQEAGALGDSYVSLEHIMLAFASSPYLPTPIAH